MFYPLPVGAKECKEVSNAAGVTTASTVGVEECDKISNITWDAFAPSMGVEERCDLLTGAMNET